MPSLTSCHLVRAIALYGLTALLMPPSVTAAGPLVPLLDCTSIKGDQLVYHFGYINPTSETIAATPGTDPNFFLPFPPERGQPTDYLPGEHHNVFTVTQPIGNTDSLTWFLHDTMISTLGPQKTCGVDRYKCYNVKGAKIDETIQLLDDFDTHFGRGARENLVVRPAFVCNPTEVIEPATATQGARTVRPFEPDVRLLCYKTVEKRKKNDPALPDVTIDDDFGDAQDLQVKKPKLVCAPSTTLPPP